ncbi:MAG: UDP-N-acetylglucosamine 1-carboxyvinyltransferase [Aggregatilineales bacterium]
MRIKVDGNQPLRGTFRVAGNSNAALAALAGSMLTDEPVTLANIPQTANVAAMLDIGQALGLQVEAHEGGRYVLKTAQIIARQLDRAQTDQLSGSILFLAPILARRQHARLMLNIPLSRYHPHLSAIRDLGGAVKVTGEGVIDFEIQRWDKRELMLTQTSVTATSLVCMLAAALGTETIVHNAASEPHVTDLLWLLRQMGAHIDGGGSNLLRIHGAPVDSPLHGGILTVSPDHVEAASVAAIAALTAGRVIVEGVRPVDLQMTLKVYERLGLRADLDADTLNLVASRPFAISERDEDVDVAVETAPWPGFPSDLAAISTVIATQARGTVLIHEKLFSNRLLFVDKLNGMGAQIVLCDPHRAIVIGPTPLRGEYIDNPDSRTGLAMLAAALCADGITTIDNAETFDRTFEHVIDRLIALGAHITRDES